MRGRLLLVVKPEGVPRAFSFDGGIKVIRLNVGLSRKVGQANFGSKGGSVNLEVEVADLDQNKLKESIHRLFNLAKQSLEEELGAEGQGEVHDKPVVQVTAQATGQTLQEAVATNCRLVSGKQITYLQNLARTQRRNLEQECEQAFQTLPERLTSKQASQLIEKWRTSLTMAR